MEEKIEALLRPTANELAVAPELGVLAALDATLATTAHQLREIVGGQAPRLVEGQVALSEVDSVGVHIPGDCHVVVDNEQGITAEGDLAYAPGGFENGIPRRPLPPELEMAYAASDRRRRARLVDGHRVGHDEIKTHLGLSGADSFTMYYYRHRIPSSSFLLTKGQT